MASWIEYIKDHVDEAQPKPIDFDKHVEKVKTDAIRSTLIAAADYFSVNHGDDKLTGAKAADELRSLAKLLP